MYHETHLKPDCVIGAGYTTCADISFQAADLFNSPNFKQELAKLTNVTPKAHTSIATLQDFVETFLDHFSKGVNGEYSTSNTEMFQTVMSSVNQLDKTWKEMGGHATVWAKRSQMEGCTVYTVPSPDPYSVENIRVKHNGADVAFLQIPDGISEQQANKGFDEHLVFEYKAGDKILGYEAPRSNRLYFVSDPLGGNFGMME